MARKIVIENCDGIAPSPMGTRVSGLRMLATFLFNGVFYGVCVHDRPRLPWPAKGWTFPITTKFGTCYTSAFESLVQRYFMRVWVPVFMVAFGPTIYLQRRLGLGPKYWPEVT